MTLWDGDRLVAAAPGYLQGQFARRVRVRPRLGACLRAARPGLLPEVAGRRALLAGDRPRLLAPRRSATRRAAGTRTGPDRGRRGLVVGARQFPRRAEDDDAFDADWLPRARRAVPLAQRRGLARLRRLPGRVDHKHRKNIRQERAKVARAGVVFRVVHGDEASEADLRGDARLLPADLRRVRQLAGADAATSCATWRDTMPRSLVLILAERDGVAHRRRAVPARRRHAVRPLLGRARARCPACISRPATTRASSTACARACALRARRAGRAQARARLPAARWCAAATGSPTRASARHCALVRGRKRSPCGATRAIARAAHRRSSRTTATRVHGHAPAPPAADDPARAVSRPRRLGTARARRPARRRRRPVARRACSTPIGTASFPGTPPASRSCGGRPTRAWCSAPMACACRRRFRRELRASPLEGARRHRFRRGGRRLRAMPAPGPGGTWITRGDAAAYGELHRLGHAHSGRGVRRRARWSAASTASRSAGCSSAKACSARSRRLEGRAGRAGARAARAGAGR